MTQVLGFLLIADRRLAGESPLVVHHPHGRLQVHDPQRNAAVARQLPDPGEADSNRVCTADMLTEREEQIVRLLSQGLTNKQMARQLGIMEDTVKKHLQHVFGKLGVRRRTLVVLRRLAGQPDSA